MICSTSSSSEAAIRGAALALLLVSGCASLDRKAGPGLEFESLVPDQPGARAARSTAIRWTASATGGSGELSYEFTTSTGFLEVLEQTGTRSTWDWTPEKAGTFRVKVTVSDASGASVDSGWSPPYVILPLATRSTPIAVLPIENLSGDRAPLGVAVQRLRAGLEQNGFRLIDEEILETFLQRHRIRTASGLSREEYGAIKAATGAEAVLITAFAAYREKRPPPEVSLFSRLVSSGDQPEILWMDSVGLSGEDAVGLLGLGRIGETGVLLDRVVHRLTDSLARYLPEAAPGAPRPDARDAEVPRGRDAPWPGLEDAVDARIRAEPERCDPRSPEGADPPAGDGVCRNGGIHRQAASFSEGESDELIYPGETRPRYAPRSVFRSPFVDARGRYSVAVVPFVNLSERKNAGKLMTLHFIEELTRVDGLRVVDPGLVREEMLRYRTVIPAGPSLATTDLLSSDRSLGVDLVLSGTVFDYGGAVVPKVDFGLEIIETASREVVWTSQSYNHGQEGVFFLDAGRVYTAHHLAANMARAAVRQLRH
jgi:TolB-like protein